MRICAASRSCGIPQEPERLRTRRQFVELLRPFLIPKATLSATANRSFNTKYFWLHQYFMLAEFQVACLCQNGLSEYHFRGTNQNSPRTPKTNLLATANQCFNSLQFLSTPTLVAEFKSLVCAKNGFRIPLLGDKLSLRRTMYKSNGSSLHTLVRGTNEPFSNCARKQRRKPSITMEYRKISALRSAPKWPSEHLASSNQTQ